LTLPGIALGVLVQVPLGWPAVGDALIGAAVGFLAFRAFEFFGWIAFRKEALGAGDKFLMAVVGAFLGVKVLLAVTFLASLQGAIFGLTRLALTGRAGPTSGPEAGTSRPEEPPLAPDTMSWDFLAPGLSLGRRLWLLPWSLLLQPIPDERKDEGGAEVEWTPGATNLPFGPWIGLAGIEVMLWGPWLGERLPVSGLAWVLGA
jgi:leader peptidase (prepilin peptidase)/N-methyltransferase